MKFLKLSKLTLLAISLASIVHAQSFPGFVSATMPGMAAAYYQPANLYVEGAGWDVTWLTLNTSMQTNMFLVGGRKGFEWKYTGQQYGFTEIQQHIQFPSFSVALDDKSALGLSVSINHFLNADFTHAISADLMTGEGEGIAPDLSRTKQEGGLVFNSWYAMGMTYARLLQDNERGQLKLGITGQLLLGNGSLSARVVLPDYEIPDRQVLDVSRFFLSSYLSNNMEHAQRFQWLWLPEMPLSLGFNTKAGLKWESKEPALMHRQGIRLDQIGIALLDLGRMYHRANHNSFLTYAEEGRDIIDLDASFKDIRDWHVLRDTIDNYSGVVAIDGSWKMSMPASLFAEVNVKIDRHYALNAAILHGFRSLNENSLVKNSRVILTPYYYNDRLAIGLPLSYNRYGRLHAGVALYTGPLMLGLDYAEDLFTERGIRNLGMYMVYHWSSLQKEKRKNSKICR